MRGNVPPLLPGVTKKFTVQITHRERTRGIPKGSVGFNSRSSAEDKYAKVERTLNIHRNMKSAVVPSFHWALSRGRYVSYWRAEFTRARAKHIRFGMAREWGSPTRNFFGKIRPWIIAHRRRHNKSSMLLLCLFVSEIPRYLHISRYFDEMPRV